jgi:hypothetical protein
LIRESRVKNLKLYDVSLGKCPRVVAPRRDPPDPFAIDWLQAVTEFAPLFVIPEDEWVY